MVLIEGAKCTLSGQRGWYLNKELCAIYYASGCWISVSEAFGHCSNYLFFTRPNQNATQAEIEVVGQIGMLLKQKYK